MPFEPGHKKAKGRKAGSKNRRTLMVEEIAAKFSVDPFEVLMMVAAGDWEALGYETKTKTTFTMNGIEVEEDNVPLAQRVQAAKEAAKYLYAAKQSVAISTGDSGIKVIVEEYKKG